MQLALLVIGVLLTLGALLALLSTFKASKEQGSIQAGSVFLAVAVMFGLGVIFLALVI